MTVPGGIGQWMPVVAISLATLPLIYPVYRIRLRQAVGRGVPVALARRWSLAEVAMVFGTVPWLWMILTPSSAVGELRLIPVVDLVQVLTGDGLTAFFQVGGNLLVFAAFGFFAPLRWRIGPGTVTLLAAGASMMVEVLQYTLELSRVTSVDDVLLNAAGAGLCALLSRRLLASPAPAPVEGPCRPGPLGA
jgi:hypothetical protein